MLSEAEDHVWDFTPVIDLIYSLSSKGGPAVTLSSSLSTELAELADAEENAGGNNDAYQSLGNFEKLWNYLGQPLDTPPPVVKSISLSLGRSLPEGGWCSRAELQNEHTLAKVVRWRDEVHGADLDDNNQNGGPVTTPALSKRQKKTKRKQHRELLAQQQTGHLTLPIINTSSDEEPSPELLQLQSTPDRRAVIQEILYGTKNGGANPVLHSSSNQRRWTSQLESLPPLNDRNGWPASSAHQQDSNRQRLDPGLIPQDFLPAAARKANLILRLRERFPLEKNYISSLGVSQDVQVDGVAADSAVHVFVDISNIMIGFHDSLKLSLGLPISARIRRVPFSFHNLSLILERGRPTAKRVLVGSDKFPAIDEAKQIGYETNILDRVHKAKELTPRQKKYFNGNGTSGQSSGSETTAMYAPQKWVEQAVDEILHLKMMESIVDVKEPSTMVLATGDAAEAEYSQGFLKMVERALGKGWKVELVSFRQNTSGAYRKGDFRSKWGDMFKIIVLDEFTEELVAD